MRGRQTNHPTSFGRAAKKKTSGGETKERRVGKFRSETKTNSRERGISTKSGSEIEESEEGDDKKTGENAQIHSVEDRSEEQGSSQTSGDSRRRLFSLDTLIRFRNFICRCHVFFNLGREQSGRVR